MKALIAILLITGLFLLNVWLYRNNQKTPVPEGCENLKPECSACGIRDCAMRRQFMNEGDENHGDH